MFKDKVNYLIQIIATGDIIYSCILKYSYIYGKYNIFAVTVVIAKWLAGQTAV